MIDSEIPKGAGWACTVTVRQNGAAFNITGRTPVATMTVGGVSVDVLASILNAPAGTVSLSLTATQTATLPANCNGELRVKLTQSGLQPLHVGTFTVRTNGGTA
jgi:hypothetical protein